MKLTLMLSLLGTAVVGAFNVRVPTASPFRPLSQSALYSTTEEASAPEADTDDDVMVESAKTQLLNVAQRLKSDYGTFLIDKSAQDELKTVVESLEAVAKDMSQDPTDLVGDWDLIVTTASADGSGDSKIAGIGGFDIDTSKLPFFNDGPIKDVRNMLTKSFKVKQRIMMSDDDNSSDDSSSDISFFNRIDHVLQYEPPSKLTEFLENVPDAIKQLNINPLQVSSSKFILIHKAKLESAIPVLKTKLSLSSVVLNVAGESQILDPKGADVVGINVPLGEFLNAGSFDTTYMDETIRISRSKVGFVDQLRVFIRSEDNKASGGTTATDDYVYEMEEYDDVIVDDDVEGDDSEEGGDDDDDDSAPNESHDASNNDDISPSDV